MSERAGALEALTDQLSEERRRSRELQWAVEKERCRTSRSEESQQEELEVRDSYYNDNAEWCYDFHV